MNCEVPIQLPEINMVNQQDIVNVQILIVDDVEANVLLLEQMLNEIGYQNISSTMDPYAVVPLHRVNHYDLILLDLQMPGMDGFQIMEELKLNQVDDYLTILVITAQIEHKWQSLAAGAKGFIGKPFDIVEIDGHIRNLLENGLRTKQQLMSCRANHK
jgi:CheY-like chemotaxis protein